MPLQYDMAKLDKAVRRHELRMARLTPAERKAREAKHRKLSKRFNHPSLVLKRAKSSYLRKMKSGGDDRIERAKVHHAVHKAAMKKPNYSPDKVNRRLHRFFKKHTNRESVMNTVNLSESDQLAAIRKHLMEHPDGLFAQTIDGDMEKLDALDSATTIEAFDHAAREYGENHPNFAKAILEYRALNSGARMSLRRARLKPKTATQKKALKARRMFYKKNRSKIVVKRKAYIRRVGSKFKEDTDIIALKEPVEGLEEAFTDLADITAGFTVDYGRGLELHVESGVAEALVELVESDDDEATVDTLVESTLAAVRKRRRGRAAAARATKRMGKWHGGKSMEGKEGGDNLINEDDSGYDVSVTFADAEMLEGTREDLDGKADELGGDYAVDEDGDDGAVIAHYIFTDEDAANDFAEEAKSMGADDAVVDEFDPEGDDDEGDDDEGDEDDDEEETE